MGDKKRRLALLAAGGRMVRDTTGVDPLFVVLGDAFAWLGWMAVAAALQLNPSLGSRDKIAGMFQPTLEFIVRVVHAERGPADATSTDYVGAQAALVEASKQSWFRWAMKHPKNPSLALCSGVYVHRIYDDRKQLRIVRE